MGYLKAGYVVDFVMLSDDVLAERFDKSQIHKTRILLTVFNGHVVY